VLIKQFFYPLTTLGPGTRLGIWTMGCSHGCFKCMSKDTWAFDKKHEIPLQDVMSMIRHYHLQNPTMGLTISGGDPFFQEELGELLRFCKKTLQINDILVYTGFTLQQLQLMKKPFIKMALEHLDVLIDGKYVHALNDDLPLRGSSNQVIHFFNPALRQIYDAILQGQRTYKLAIEGSAFRVYGVVPKSFIKRLKTKSELNGIQLDFSSFDQVDKE